MGAPELPRNISADGREIWDWASKLSTHIHRQDEIRRLSRDIADIGTKCGDCFHWMKSGSCPRETRNNAGRRVGPSMNGPKCSKFEEEAWQTKRREELTAKVAALKALDQPNTATGTGEERA